jgi:hypothetical protein
MRKQSNSSHALAKRQQPLSSVLQDNVSADGEQYRLINSSPSNRNLVAIVLGIIYLILHCTGSTNYTRRGGVCKS